MEDDKEFLKLPIEDRCVHKLWKARLNGYEEAAKLFRKIDDDKSPEWSKYLGLLKKFVTDSNAPAQEKGLEAVLAYVENYGSAGRTVGEVMAGLVAKCIGAKPKTKELSAQIALMYIEIEKSENVIDELLKGTEAKNPKTTCGCLSILTQSLKEFGPKVVSVGKVAKKVSILLSDRDQNVRQEAKVLIVEIYRWIGPPFKNQLNNLKPVQMTELETEFEKLPKGTPAPTRLLRSQQAKKVGLVEASSAGETGGATEDYEEEEIDPTEFLEPVDVLSKLPKDFYTQLEAKKWVERRDALTLLDKELSAAPKLENGDYGDLVRALKKIIAKDSNVVVVAEALKCMAGLANGLKKKFGIYVSALMATLLEKFKEKKQNVVQALRDVVDAIFLVTTLEQISEDVITALDNKNPGVKSETCLFLARCFTRCTPAILNKKLLKLFTPPLTKTLNDSDLPVRDAASQALGTIYRVVGEKILTPFLGDIGDVKMSKIKSVAEKVELLKPIKAAKTEEDGDSSAKSGSKSGPRINPQSKGKKGPVKSAPPGVRGGAAKAVEASEGVSQELRSELANVIPVDLISGLVAKDDETRIKANEQLFQVIKKNSVQSTEGLMKAVVLTATSDLDEELDLKLQMISHLAENYNLDDCDLTSTVKMLLKKLSEGKHVDKVGSCLSVLAKFTNSDDIAMMLLSPETVKNTAMWTVVLKWLSEGVINYDLCFSEDFLQKEAKKAIQSGNGCLRNAGLALIGSLHMMSKKAPNETSAGPVKPPRNTAVKKREKEKEAEATESVPGVTFDLMSLASSGILNEFTDDTWKTRHDAVAKLQAHISPFDSVNPNLGEFQIVIEDLISDKNSKVVLITLSLVSNLVKKMGPQAKQYTRSFVPKILKNLGDAKNWVRSAVISTLNTWGSVTGYKEFFDNDNIADVIKGMLPPLSRTELWNWLAPLLTSLKSVPKDGLIACLPHLYQNLEDRSAEVRKAANDAVVPFMLHIGYDCMLSETDNMKGSKTQIKAILEKNRGSVPEPLDPLPKCLSAGNIPSSKSIKLVPGSSATFTKPPSKARASSAGVSRLAASKRKDDDAGDNSGPLLERNSSKHQRVIDEQKLKTLRWNFVTPRLEFIELLREQMGNANFNQTLVSYMFHTDFRYHIKAIDLLAEDLLVNRDGLVSNLDLVLKWTTLRFFDTNPSVLLRGLEYLNNVFNCLIEDHYNLLDTEASSFLPYLLLKAGDPKDTVRNQVKNIFKLIASLYPRTKMFGVLMDGLKSKNARQRSEILEYLGWLIETFTLSSCPNVNVSLKEIARHIGDRDTAVRNAALGCMVSVYFQVGEHMYKIIGQLPQKDLSILEERIKRAVKNRPVASVKPMQNDQSVPSISPGKVSPGSVSPSKQSVASEVSEESDDNILNSTVTMNQSEEREQERERERERDREPATPPRGPFSLDPMVDDKGAISTAFLPPEVPSIDLHFLKDARDNNFSGVPRVQQPSLNSGMPVGSATSATNTTASLKWEIHQIVNADLEKAINSMAQLETILYSDKASMLRPYLDFMVQQLAQQLALLTQSTHPDLVNCYRGNFSLIIKLSERKSLFQEVSESNLQKLMKQLLLLLAEHKLETIGQDMFKSVNNVVIKLLESANKTAIMCVLLRILHDTVNSSSSKHFQELVVKCLWKLNRSYADWDLELNYPKVLTEINIFLQDYPSAFWRTQEADIPLRTVKTILHTMVKMRGAQVKDYLKQVPSLSSESEMASYIRRVIRHLKLEENDSIGRSPKGPQEELNEIMRNVSDSIMSGGDVSEALHRLNIFTRMHPEIDLDVYISKTALQVQKIIRRSLARVDNDPSENTVPNPVPERPASRECEEIWNRLGQWKERAGCPLDKKSSVDINKKDLESRIIDNC